MDVIFALIAFILECCLLPCEGNVEQQQANKDDMIAPQSIEKSVLLAITHCCRRVDQTDMLLKNIAELGHDVDAEVMIFEDIVAGKSADYPADTNLYRVRHAMNGPHGLTHLWNMAFRVWKFERPSTDILLLSNNDVLYAPGCMSTFLKIFAATPLLSGKPYALGPLCFAKGCGENRHQDVGLIFEDSFNGSGELEGLPGTLAKVQRKVNDPTVRAAAKLPKVKDPMVQAGAKLQEDMFEASGLLGFSWAFHRNIIGSGHDFSEGNLFDPTTVNVNQEWRLFQTGLPAGVNTRCFVHHWKGTTLSIIGVDRDDLGTLNLAQSLYMDGAKTFVIWFLPLIVVLMIIKFKFCSRKSSRFEQ